MSWLYLKWLRIKSENLLHKFFILLCFLFFFPTVSLAAVDEVFVIIRKANAPDASPNINVKTLTRKDFNYDYELYQLSFDMSAGEYLVFHLGFDNYTNTASYVLFDQVELTGPSGAVTLVNPGFEAGTTGWERRGPPWAISTFTTSTDAYEGSEAGKLAVDNASLDGYCSIRNTAMIPIVETGTYTFQVYAKVYEGEFPPDDIFAFEVGNQWTYDSNNEIRVIKFNQTKFNRDTYEVESFENGISTGREWYEIFKGYLMLWGLEEDGDFLTFEDGLIVAWFPASIGDRRESSTKIGDYITISAVAEMTAHEQIALSFATFDAYKLHIVITISGPGGTVPLAYDWWFVPYLGIIKLQEDQSTELLTSFAIGGGAITQDTDTDGDGLKDYEEIIIYTTDRFDTDTDGDRMPDGWEVANQLLPLTDDASGDLDGDGYVNLREYLAGSDPTDPDSIPRQSGISGMLLLLFDN